MRRRAQQSRRQKRDRPKSTSSSTNSNASRLFRHGRLAIGDRLAEIGDPRAGVGLDVRGLPALDWVEIPGGEFIYQNGEKRRLPTFRMARYPITNAQYQAFIDAGGYTDKGASTWWRDLKRSEPAQSSWPQANRPRTDVDWYEAVAFSRWLSAQLGYEVRLAERGRVGACGARTRRARVSLGQGLPDGLRQY
jgi:hypothetical protein